MLSLYPGDAGRKSLAQEALRQPVMLGLPAFTYVEELL